MHARRLVSSSSVVVADGLRSEKARGSCLKRTLAVEFEGGLVRKLSYQDFAIRKVDLDFKDSFRGLELTVSGGEDVVVIVTNTACLMHSVHT
jgi:hypothetical protein